MPLRFNAIGVDADEYAAHGFRFTRHMKQQSVVRPVVMRNARCAGRYPLLHQPCRADDPPAGRVEGRGKQRRAARPDEAPVCQASSVSGVLHYQPMPCVVVVDEGQRSLVERRRAVITNREEDGAAFRCGVRPAMRAFAGLKSQRGDGCRRATGCGDTPQACRWSRRENDVAAGRPRPRACR